MLARILLLLVAVCLSVCNFAAQMRIWSQSRGFEPFGGEIQNGDAQELYRMATVNLGEDDFQWNTTIASIHNAPGKKYYYLDAEQKKKGVMHPAYGCVMVSEKGDTILLHLQTLCDNPRDKELYCNPKDVLQLKLFLKRKNEERRLLARAELQPEQADIFTGANIISIGRKDDMLTVAVGNRKLENRLNLKLEDFSIKKIGYVAAAASLLKLEYVRLFSTSQEIIYPIPDDFDNQSDPVQGIWSVAEFSLDSEWYALGGLYSLAIVRDENFDSSNIYNILYLSGADAAASQWKSGQLKGRLKPSEFVGVYEAEWLDSEHHYIEADKPRVQADVIDNPMRYDMLTVIFPIRNSSIVLKRVK